MGGFVNYLSAAQTSQGNAEKKRTPDFLSKSGSRIIVMLWVRLPSSRRQTTPQHFVFWLPHICKNLFHRIRESGGLPTFFLPSHPPCLDEHADLVEGKTFQNIIAQQLCLPKNRHSEQNSWPDSSEMGRIWAEFASVVKKRAVGSSYCTLTGIIVASEVLRFLWCRI